MPTVSASKVDVRFDLLATSICRRAACREEPHKRTFVQTSKIFHATSSLSDLKGGAIRDALESRVDSRMGVLGMSNFRTIDRQTGFLLPPSVDEWLPEKHLARFVVEVIDGLDLRR